jgi:citrate lyase subunit beta/citryl-CoA lyase
MTLAAAWRSLLFMPAHAERFVASAHRRGADAVILDLEDAVASSAKAEARAAVVPNARRLAEQGLTVLVRVNADEALLRADLSATAAARVACVLVPKVESAAMVTIIAAELARLEGEAGAGAPTSIMPLIETPEGVLEARAIAASSERVVALGFGPEDFAAAVGLPPDPVGLAMPAQLVALAAHARKLAAIGLPGSIAAIEDLGEFAKLVDLARKLGFTGSVCIHPAQVPVLNAGFAPSAEEIAAAEAIRTGYQAALAKGEGAVAVGGRMVDQPVYARALATLARGRYRGERGPA